LSNVTKLIVFILFLSLPFQLEAKGRVFFDCHRQLAWLINDSSIFGHSKLKELLVSEGYRPVISNCLLSDLTEKIDRDDLIFLTVSKFSTYKTDEVVYSLSRASFMTALFMTESWDLLKIASKDRLHQTRRMKQMPELFEVQKIALSKGALMSTLSGSGSTFFTLCYVDDAHKIHKALEAKFPKYRVFTKSLDNYGVTSKS